MADGDFSSLELRGPVLEDDFEVYEAVDSSSADPADHVYSCVAICRKDWTDQWPALGGTRWFKKDRARAPHEAVELAMSMYIKSSLLRKSAHSLHNGNGSHGLFNWQGGKGVIWTPSGAELTPHRLRCHGRLIDWLQGQYVASGDVGVGEPELEQIALETRHLIGLNCRRDTGEATAYGIFAGLRQAALEQAEELGADPTDPIDPLRGVPVLVIGAGKVGFPLLRLLHDAGAEVWVYDEFLKPDAVEAWYEKMVQREAAVGAEHLAALQAIQRAGRIFSTEEAALADGRFRIVSPNGGMAEWLSRAPEWSAATRAEILAETRGRHGALRLILGAGNDQVSTTPAGKNGRDRTLSTLKAAGISFVPDPLVSPGGVISVSHERAAAWNAEAVNGDSMKIVRRSVEQLYAESRRRGGIDAVTMYRAFEELTARPSWS
jgi:glutamate dehydrogenase/leucine dehydrogenase